MRIGIFIVTVLYPMANILGMAVSVVVIKFVPMIISYIVTAMVMTIIIVIPVVMISVIEMPGEGLPWMPV
jgi:hypothetical protein